MALNIMHATTIKMTASVSRAVNTVSALPLPNRESMKANTNQTVSKAIAKAIGFLCVQCDFILLVSYMCGLLSPAKFVNRIYLH